MGQLEPLTALALGRGHYEDEIAWSSGSILESEQSYNHRGHPINPETKRRERENIRAANEVMLASGIVEDAAVAMERSRKDEEEKQIESFIGFKLIEVGRAFLHTGVWGVIGLRRRILVGELYKPYTILKITEILHREKEKSSLHHVFFSGLPMALIPHTSDYLVLTIEAFLDYIHGSEVNGHSTVSSFTNSFFQEAIELIFRFLKLQFGLFSILQQLNLIPESKIFPDFISLIPFTSSSLIKFNPKKSTTAPLRILLWIEALTQSIAPLLIIRGYEKIQLVIWTIIYRRIYICLPRPTRPSLMSKYLLHLISETDENTENIEPSRLNSLPNVACEAIANDLESASQNIVRDGLEEEDGVINHAQLLSLHVEPYGASEGNRNGWSATLRSAYRVTGLTLLPTILATEGLTDVLGDIIVLPVEALMVRLVGAAYRASAGLNLIDQYEIGLRPRGFANLCFAYTLQLTITGVIWGGFTFLTNWYAVQRQVLVKKKYFSSAGPE
ncbi:hypothetical protein GcC1_105001 [Golovinomyces cichoracearum]|uniref:Uncharacterized protein n=1 Tax=Golovinomyces cichoracearum TaxID=62708 RepID=A0A420I9I8_9PEZI|nr:hypothetical protein GcC1_105001 [Golovinomyces cichoracearum]